MAIRKKFLLTAFFLSFYLVAISQEVKVFLEEAEKTQKGTWGNDLLGSYQIGINTQLALDGIFTQSIRTPLEMLIRKQIGNDQAIRVRVFGTTHNSRRNELDYLTEISQSALGLALGYEWQQMISKRWDWYYGLEVEGHKLLHNELEDYHISNEYNEERYHVIILDDQITTRLSLLPMIGFRFKVTPRLFVHTEFKLEAFTEKYDYKIDYNVTTINGTRESRETSSEEVSGKEAKINFQPYTGVFINLIL